MSTFNFISLSDLDYVQADTQEGIRQSVAARIRREAFKGIEGVTLGDLGVSGLVDYVVATYGLSNRVQNASLARACRVVKSRGGDVKLYKEAIRQTLRLRWSRHCIAELSASAC